MCIVQYVDMVGNNIKTMHNKKLNVTQGNISYINLRTKKERTNRSSFAFFDVGQKSPISYNLKHWFRHNPCMVSPFSSPIDMNSSSLATAEHNEFVKNSSEGVSGAIAKHNKFSSLILKKHQLGSILFVSKPPVISKSRVGECINLPWGDKSNEINFARKSSKKNKSLSMQNPDVIRHQFQKDTIWKWLDHCSSHDEPITGRISRSLNRAGLCVLLGGFPAFLPHRQYSLRNEIISKKEGQLKSFQIISLKGPKSGSPLKNDTKWNCVLSKDQFTRSCARKF